MSPTPAIRTHGLSRSFGDITALEALDMTVERGEIHAVVGLNGAGKTTLMRLLLGMLRPSAGIASVDGWEASRAPADVWRRVGHLVEVPFAYPELTVTENLRAAALLHGLDPERISDDVPAALDIFGLAAWSGRRAGTLSQGNRQRLGLATALVHRPSILVLDEPANGLDPAGIVAIRDLVVTRATAGAAVLVSSHHLDQVARIADRITVLHRGRAVGMLDPGSTDLERRFFDLVLSVDRAAT